MTGSALASAALVQLGDLLPEGSRVDVFEEIYWVFLGLGTVVGVVVIGYMVYNAIKYRDDGGEPAETEDRPELGELPSGGGKGRKLFLSFTLSAIIVVSLIVWTYGALLYVEGSQADGEEAMTVDVTGYQFGWNFTYPNGHSNTTLVVPAGERVWISVTSTDVMHNFGIPAMDVKTDAIPGERTETWFVAEEPGTYEAVCYELCGVGHSYMTAEVVVMEPDRFEEWYENRGADAEAASPDASGQNATGSDTGTNASGANATAATATPAGGA